MPSSQLHQLNEVTNLIKISNPKKLLDIGVGFGKYGFLAREYLELWDGREKYRDWKRQIDGIEAFPEYLTPIHDYIYDTIYKGNALDVLPKLKIKYDLILLIDVLEHFTYEEGRDILAQCRKLSKNILISAPLDNGEQEDSFGNPFEEHKYEWKKKDLSSLLPNSFFLPNDYSEICFFGESAAKVKQTLQQERATINRKKRPLLYLPERALRKISPK